MNLCDVHILGQVIQSPFLSFGLINDTAVLLIMECDVPLHLVSPWLGKIAKEMPTVHGGEPCTVGYADAVRLHPNSQGGAGT